MAEDKNTWSENVILVDCSYMDTLLQDFKKNFSAMIGRPLGMADLCHWLDCMLLDAQAAQGSQTFVALIHNKQKQSLAHFNPGKFQQLHQQAFRDNLSEFVISCYPVESMTNSREMMVESLRACMEAPQVKHILVAGDMEAYVADLGKAASQPVPDTAPKAITLFSMMPIPTSDFYQSAIIGYSLMSALGIRSEELM